MSEQIDWSKAPEGSEYSGTISGGQIPVFYRNVKQNSFEYSYGDNYGWSGPVSGEPSCKPLIPRPTTTSWSGEGLPPVGTVCEIAESTDGLKISYPAGHKVKIYAHFTHVSGREIAAFADDASQVYGCGYYRIFKPIRTPEQIAADEREAAIDQIMDDLSLSPECRYIAKRVLDAGYIKP